MSFKNLGNMIICIALAFLESSCSLQTSGSKSPKNKQNLVFCHLAFYFLRVYISITTCLSPPVNTDTILQCEFPDSRGTSEEHSPVFSSCCWLKQNGSLTTSKEEKRLPLLCVNNFESFSRSG